MMNPFFRKPPPAGEEEKRVWRAIAWLAVALCSLRRRPSPGADHRSAYSTEPVNNSLTVTLQTARHTSIHFLW